MDTYSIEKKLNLLTEELKSEVMDFIDFLLLKRKSNATQKKDQFDFLWEGGLSEAGQEFSSVELQHRSTDWR